ncbi:MAG: alpha/beta hydrolase [Oscillospiraceae bacterium]|nr:alpha/beta hydrolase [Oscillospiraceae bacterium]
MNFEKSEDYFRSSNGTDNITYYIYNPITEPKAVIQITHGMCEYIERYEEFIDFLCRNGFAVCGHDHLGHGKSVLNDDYLGFFAHEKGWQYLVKDTVQMSKIIRKQYPEKPLFLIGHSLGSLTARVAVSKCGYLYNSVILLGALNTKVKLDSVMLMADTIRRASGDMCRSEIIEKMIYGYTNVKIDDPVNKFAWLSRDDELVYKFYDNPKCNFIFTVSAFCDLIKLFMYATDKRCIDAVPKHKPFLILGGEADPIGQWGKGPRELLSVLENAGCTAVEMKLYDGARHELLNEINRNEVYNDILEWCNSHISEMGE